MSSAETPENPSLPEAPRKAKRKGPGQFAVGRPKVSAEDKKNGKEKRKAARAALINQLYAEGKISGPEARRQAKKAGVTLEGEIDLKDTKDDPSLIGKYEQKVALQQKVIDLVGGKGISTLDDVERNTFLSYLEVGMGRHAACRQMKIDYRRFVNTFRCDDAFRADVITVEESLIGLCTMRIYNAASDGDLASAAKFISIKQGSSDAAFQRKLQLARHRLEQKAMEAQLDMMQTTNRPSFTCFSDTELDEYTNITEKLKAGEPASTAEMARLGVLSAKLIAANAPSPGGPPAEG